MSEADDYNKCWLVTSPTVQHFLIRLYFWQSSQGTDREYRHSKWNQATVDLDRSDDYSKTLYIFHQLRDNIMMDELFQEEPAVITLDNVADYLHRPGGRDVFDVNVQAVIKTKDAPNASKQFYLNL